MQFENKKNYVNFNFKRIDFGLNEIEQNFFLTDNEYKDKDKEDNLVNEKIYLKDCIGNLSKYYFINFQKNL